MTPSSTSTTATWTRIWESWQVQRGRVYQPLPTDPANPLGHPADRPLCSILNRQQVAPADRLHVQSLYGYDALLSTAAPERLGRADRYGPMLRG